VDIIELDLQGGKDFPERAANQSDEDRQDNDILNNALPISIMQHNSSSPWNAPLHFYLGSGVLTFGIWFS
jgi:predicted RNA-binding protein